TARAAARRGRKLAEKRDYGSRLSTIPRNVRAVAGLTRHRREALGHLPPVDHVPPRVDVIGPAVVVLQVVGVLPDVDAEQRRLAVADRVVLVGAGDHRQTRAVVDEPGPAGAELVDAGVIELALEVIEGPERGVDRVAQRAVGLAPAVRGHPLPEQRVVVMAAPV